MKYVSGLMALDRADAARLGERAIALGQLTRRGFPVPPGFVVLPEAFDRFVAANDLRARLARWLAVATPDVPPTLVEAARELDALIGSAPVPPDLADAIQAPLWAIDDGHVRFVVRASRPPAPGPSAGRATLNADGLAGVLAGVRSCWGSAFRPRELLEAARARPGAGSRAGSRAGRPLHPAAVVVQAMVDAVKSGVLDTAAPRPGGPDAMAIQAVWGLGGPRTPAEAEAYDLDREDLAVRRIEPGHQAFKLVRGDCAAPLRLPLTPAERGARRLGPAELAELGRLGRAAEAAFGGPLRLEWAIDRERAHVLHMQPWREAPTRPAVPNGGTPW